MYQKCRHISESHLKCPPGNRRIPLTSLKHNCQPDIAVFSSRSAPSSKLKLRRSRFTDDLVVSQKQIHCCVPGALRVSQNYFPSGMTSSNGTKGFLI